MHFSTRPGFMLVSCFLCYTSRCNYIYYCEHALSSEFIIEEVIKSLSKQQWMKKSWLGNADSRQTARAAGRPNAALSRSASL